MLRTIAAAILLTLATGHAAIAAPQIEHIIVKVEAANDEWTPTPIKLAAGDLLIIMARGKIKVGEFLGTTDANGKGTGEGALHIKVGTTHTRLIGTRALVENEATGAVKLRIRDTHYTDNEGAFEVRLLKIPAELVPPAKTVADE